MYLGAKNILLSIQTGFSLVNTAVVCAILESISGLTVVVYLITLHCILRILPTGKSTYYTLLDDTVYIALYSCSIALYCIVLYYIGLICIALHSIELDCITLCCSSKFPLSTFKAREFLAQLARPRRAQRKRVPVLHDKALTGPEETCLRVT